MPETPTETLARLDAVARLLPRVVAELVNRLPEEDRAAIRNLLDGLAEAADVASRINIEGNTPRADVALGTHHFHVEAKRLLALIASPPGASGQD